MAGKIYAVIFSSHLRENISADYALEADTIAERVKGMPGFIRLESVRATSGEGITVCYWESLDAINRWKEDSEHRQAQEHGKERWYARYRVTVTQVEYEYSRTEE